MPEEYNPVIDKTPIDLGDRTDYNALRSVKVVTEDRRPTRVYDIATGKEIKNIISGLITWKWDTYPGSFIILEIQDVELTQACNHIHSFIYSETFNIECLINKGQDKLMAGQATCTVNKNGKSVPAKTVAGKPQTTIKKGK